MITLITGAPGAGKTCALVDLLIKECQRRAVYVDGIPDLKVPHLALPNPRDWMTEVPDGSAVVIDEVQRVWRPRGSAAAVPKDVAALETHRHRGLDFYLVTQHPNLLDANVKRLVGRHVHLRDAGYLGRWWYEWTECGSPDSLSKALVKKRYTLSKEAQALYTSASMHIKPIRSMPRALVVFLLCVPLAIGGAWNAVARVNDKHTQAAKESEAMKRGRLPGQAEPVGAAVAPAAAPQTVGAPARHAQDAETDGRPAVVGCFSSQKTCRCFDRQGFPVVIEWELCKVSASSYAGLVPLDVSPPEVASVVDRLSGAGGEPPGRSVATEQR